MCRDRMRECRLIVSSQPLRRGCREGFTLSELLISAVISGMLLVSVGGALTYVMKAADSSRDTNVQMSSTAAVVDRITQDLGEAITVPERTAKAVTLTVPDRDGDGAAETLRYAWSGVIGSPLTLQYNTEAPVTLAANVTSFDLTYLWRLVGPPTGGCCKSDGSCTVLDQADCAAITSTYYKGDNTDCGGSCLQESAELVLASNDWPIAGDIQDLIMKNNGVAEFFAPVLPSNTYSWKIKKVQLKLKRLGSATGTLTVVIRNVDTSNKPTGSALASKAIDISTVSSASYVWVDANLADVSGIAPGTTMAVQATTPSATNLCDLAWDKKGTDASMGWMTGTSAGAGWTTPASNKVMEYYVYGTYTTVGPPQ